jgi:hypothetical protein
MGAGEGETLSHGDAGYFEQHNEHEKFSQIIQM